MLDVCGMINTHFHTLKESNLSFEVKSTEYSKVEKLFNGIRKDKLNKYLEGLNDDVYDILVRDMAAESINILKHALSIMSDLLEINWGVLNDKQKVLRQLIMITQKNASLSHNSDITCKAFQCIRFLCDSETAISHDSTALKGVVAKCLDTTLRNEEPLKLQSLLLLKAMLQHKLWDCKENTNNWLKYLTNCIFDKNAKIRGAALSTFNIFKAFLSGKEDYLDKIATNLIPLKYSKFLIELVPVDKNWAVIWRLMVEIMGKRLHSSSILVNSLLAVEEKAFKTPNIETKKEAFTSWKTLILNFASEHSVLTSERRVKLITIPLRANNCRSLDMAQVKLDVWWYVVTLMRSDVARFQETVLIPFLKFCFGPLNDGGLLSSNGQSMLNSTSNGEALGRIYPAVRMPCLQALAELLSKSAGVPLPKELAKDLVITPLLEPPLVSQKDFCHSSRVLTQCIGEVVLLVGQDLEQLPWIIHAWQSLLILINKGTGETISFNLNDSNSKDLKCVAMVKDTLRLLVNLLDAVATMSEAKTYGQVVLSMIKSLVIGDAALHASVLNSHVYAVGSTQVMNGTPTMLLAMLLLSPTILNDKTSHTRYMEVFSKLLTLGLNGIAPPLPFARALLKKLEAHVSSEQFSSAHMTSLREIWISIVNHLSDAIDKDGSISEGNDAVHDFQCIYGLLMLPISHFLKSEFEKESIETLLKPWKRLFELFFMNAQLVITTQSSEVIEELCKKILVAAKKINVSSNYIAHLMQFVLIIYGVNFYESYWKVSKSPPQAATGLALKGEKMNVFYNSQQLLIMLFYKISELMPLSNDDNGSTDKHSSIIQFLILMFSSALRYNFLNFLFDKGVICVGYYLKLTAGQLKYKTSLEKEMVKLWEKFLEYIEKKVFFTKGKFQPLIDIVTPLLEKGFTHPLPKIVELTTSHWIRSLGQICSKAKINKSLSDILDCTLKDTSGSEDVTEMAALEEKAFKSPKILRNTNWSEKPLKIVSDVNQSMTSKGNNVEFKVIPPKTKAPVLTDHQKEMLKVRRVDIPALYQDLTQDSASQSFSSEILPSPALNPAPSSLASDISEDANPPFSKENDLHKEEVLSATKRISVFTELNVLNSKATEITGNGDKTLQLTSRSKEGNGDNDDPSKMQNTDEEGILSPKGSDQPSPVLPSEMDRMVNTRKRRKQNLTPQVNNSDKSKPDREDASVVVKTYSNTSTRKRKEMGLTNDESCDKAAPKFSGLVLTPKRELVVNSSVCGIEVSKADSSRSKESNSETLEGTNFVGLISDDGSKKSNKLSSTSIPQKLNADATTSSTLTDVSMPNLAVENLSHELKTTEVSSKLLDPSTGIQRSTSEAATNLLLPTSSSNTEDSGLRNQTLVSQKPTSKAEVSSLSANHVSPKSVVDARPESASPALGVVKRVLRKSATKRQSNLHQSKVLHLQDFAKENEIPSVSSGEVTTGPKKRGRPKETSNISSPSTSSNTGRNKRKSNDTSNLECTLNVAEENFKDTADNKGTKCDKELPISSIADLNPCSEENVGCDEKLSVVDQEDNSKGLTFNASKVMKNEVVSNTENSSNNEKKECESAKLVKDKPSQLNSKVNTCGNQEECSREAKESSGVDPAKPISSSSSPKSKLSHGSPKSKSLGQSPSLDKWVIVTKRESGGKVLKKENDAPEIQVISADEAAKDVSNSVEGGSSTEHDLSSSEDIVDSSQEPMDTSSSSLKGVTKKCTVHLSRMSGIFSNEVAFIPFEGKILKCNLSPSKKEESKGDSDSKRSALANGPSVATNLFLSPRSNTGRGARILNLAQGNKERDAFEESSGSPLKEVDSKHSQLNSDSLQGSPLSHLRSPEYGNSTPPMKRPRRIRPVQIGNVSPQYRSLEIGCVVSDGDITIHNYSPNASPGGSLMKKRKIPQELGEDSISPSSKKSRRVSFADPIVSKHVEFCIPESERKFKKRGVNRCLKMPYGSPDERLLINEDDFGHSEIDVKEPSVNVADNEATSPIKAPSSLPCPEEPNDVEKPLTVDVGSSVIEEQSLLEKPGQQNSLIIDSQKCLTSVSVTDTDVIVLSPPMEGKHSNGEKQNLKPSSGISDEPTAAKEMMPHKKVLFSSQAGQQKEDPCVKESQSLTSEPTQSNSTSVSANDQDTILLSPPTEDKNSNGAEQNLTSSLGVSAELTADDEDVISNENVPLSSQTEHEPCVRESASSVGEPMETNPPSSEEEEVSLCDARQQLQESISSSQISDSQVLSEELESVRREVDPEPRTHRLNSKEEACPSLRDCSDPVDEVLSQLTSRYWTERCKSVLESKSIMTIGDLSRLTEEAVQYVPFRVNKWKNLKAALNAYKFKLDGRAAPESGPEIDSMLTVKEETSGEMKMKIFREMLSKLSVQEVAKELHFVNMAEDVIQEIGNNMQVISSSSSPSDKHAKGDADDVHAEGLCVNSAQTSKSVASQVSDDELGSIPFDVFQSLTNRSDLKDLVGELSVEKIMQLLKCVAAVVHEKESLSDGSVDVTARRILHCALSEFMIESESTDSVNQLLWLFQNTLSSQERLKSIPSLLNCIDACLLAELILKEESIMKNIQNQISPSKALLIALNSLSQSDLSSLPLDERNRLGDILDESRTTEDLVDRFSYKIKQRLSKNHDTH